jgi:hypothetical protein
MAEITRIEKEEDFDAHFEKFAANEEFWLAYFTGGINESGESWCSDCVVGMSLN